MAEGNGQKNGTTVSIARWVEKHQRKIIWIAAPILGVVLPAIGNEASDWLWQPDKIQSIQAKLANHERRIDRNDRENDRQFKMLNEHATLMDSLQDQSQRNSTLIGEIEKRMNRRNVGMMAEPDMGGAQGS